MATYKVLQDIEAEDKILGPLTLKQFAFAIIAAIGLYVTFLGLSRGFLPILLISLPMAIFFGVLAWPFGRDQPTEVWLGSRIAFIFKPKTRIWSQDGVQELVQITAPKREIVQLFDPIDQSEVKSRLKALANTLDSRGWAVKNVNVNLSAQPGYFDNNSTTDRLMGNATFSQQVPSIDIAAADDIMDPNSNPVAHHFDEAIKHAAETSRARALQAIEASRNQNAKKPANNSDANYWFMNNDTIPASSSQKGQQQIQQIDPIPAGSATFGDAIVQPGQSQPKNTSRIDDPAAEATLQEAKKRLDAQTHAKHERVIQTPHRKAPESQNRTSATTGAHEVKPAILELAKNNEYSVATLAAQAKRIENELKEDDVVSLH